MRLTIPHYFDFGRDQARVGDVLVEPGSWDAARDLEGPFGLPATREAWEARATHELERRARAVVDLAKTLGARTLCSYGVGTGVLELCIARERPELELVCTDYAPRTVERLRGLFGEATVVRHDLRSDEPIPADLHLLHRVDTELDDAELAAALRRFREPVLLVPTHLLDVRLLARAAYLRLVHRRATRAGWLRTRGAFLSLWRDSHDVAHVQIGGTPAFLLSPRARS